MQFVPVPQNVTKGSEELARSIELQESKTVAISRRAATRATFGRHIGSASVAVQGLRRILAEQRQVVVREAPEFEKAELGCHVRDVNLSRRAATKPCVN